MTFESELFEAVGSTSVEQSTIDVDVCWQLRVSPGLSHHFPARHSVSTPRRGAIRTMNNSLLNFVINIVIILIVILIVP